MPSELKPENMSGVSRLTRTASRLAQKAVVSITPSAATRIKYLCGSHEPEPARAIRLGVRTRGCNGMSYTMNFAEAPAKLDEVVAIPDSDVQLFIDSKALMHVIGTTMDFVEDDVAAEFVFNNPNSKGSCGCGESFTV